MDLHGTLVRIHSNNYFGANGIMTLLSAGVFSRLLPLAKQFNVRIVLINRRGYPGSIPFEEVELRQLSSIKSNASNALFILEDHMKERAKELHDFLADFVHSEKISVAGGLVVAGWSFGSAWITGLIAHSPEISDRNIRLTPYIRRLVLYGKLCF